VRLAALLNDTLGRIPNKQLKQELKSYHPDDTQTRVTQ